MNDRAREIHLRLLLDGLLNETSRRIGWFAYLMWNMSEKEISAYETIADEKNLTPQRLLDKYGLSGDFENLVSPCHYLVVRYCEEHQDVGRQYLNKEIHYYDVLAMAEELYLGL